jgi:hypothetical protein
MGTKEVVFVLVLMFFICIFHVYIYVSLSIFYRGSLHVYVSERGLEPLRQIADNA